jgi:hypothetical protein
MADELDDDDNIKKRQRKKRKAGGERKAPKELQLKKIINQRHLSSSPRTTVATQIISLAALMRDLARVFPDNFLIRIFSVNLRIFFKVE